MTPFGAQKIAELVSQSGYLEMTVRLGLFAVVPLLVLLLERELATAWDPNAAQRPWLRLMNTLAAPLLVVVVLILAVRLAALLGHL